MKQIHEWPAWLELPARPRPPEKLPGSPGRLKSSRPGPADSEISEKISPRQADEILLILLEVNEFMAIKKKRREHRDILRDEEGVAEWIR